MDDGSARPRRIAVGYQSWRDLVWLHWPAEPAQVRALVPPVLDLDTFDGAAWLSMVAFAMRRVRPSVAPPALSIDALGLNLRTYVRLRGAEPAIYGFSLDTDSAVLAAGGRAGLGLPYHVSRLTARAADASLAYTLDRRMSIRRARARLEVRAGGALGLSRTGSLERFLTERFFIHAPRVGGLVTTVQIHHPPFRLHSAGVTDLTEDVTAAARVPPPDPASLLAHTAESTEVELFAPWHRRP